MNSKQTLLVKWQVKEEKLDEVLSLITPLKQASRQEPGNLAYEVYQSQAERSVIFLREIYANAAAVEAHKASSHYQSLVVEQIMPLLSHREVHFVNAQ